MRDYEKLGAFYLGRTVDPTSGAVSSDPLLYDSKDLTTHAVCVGMTGSGKTGLAISLIEEAAIDGIPVIAIDPKGDLGNLLLTFPQLRETDFLPWIEPAAAARAGHRVEEQARATAEMWRNGLAEWDQSPERIARFAQSIDRVLYTPGSQAGRPLAILKSFAAPPPALRGEGDALRERVLASVSGLLALLKIDADPIRSREHILLSTLLAHEWGEGRDLDLASLIQKIQTPPFQRVGVMNLDTFYPAGQRFELAMMLNNLMASPGFAAWTQGDALDIGSLLYGRDGRPRLSILSIAHLADAERMFLVTALLNELVAWMRTQSGSQTLRAILYMDEVFGYFPPTANPPSKTPMLTLLKQARAFGLGIVLATQNPVDLDYKGLANAGTWFLGRLQTERDKARVIEGLEGASAAAGASFDRQAMERTLAGLGKRVFLMNNVHEDRPTLFQTRWTLSYLAGPLSREQIRTLADSAAEIATAAPEPSLAAPSPGALAAPETSPPVLPAEIRQGFLAATRTPAEGEALLYRPALLGVATLHYSDRKRKIDEWRRLAFLERIDADNAAMPWEDIDRVSETAPALDAEARPGARFTALPSAATRAASYARWAKMLATAAYRAHPLTLLACKDLGLCSRPGESEGEFRGRLRDARRAQRDIAVEKLRQSYAPRLARLQERVQSAQRRVEVEEGQYAQQRTHAIISIGATVVGALFGRKLASAGNVGRATTAMRGTSRASREHADIARAEEKVEDLRQQLAAMEDELATALAKITAAASADPAAVEEISIAPRKSDTAVESIVLVWTPWLIDANGAVTPAFAS